MNEVPSRTEGGGVLYLDVGQAPMRIAELTGPRQVRASTRPGSDERFHLGFDVADVLRSPAFSRAVLVLDDGEVWAASVNDDITLAVAEAAIDDRVLW